jgi:hypothetical protein
MTRDITIIVVIDPNRTGDLLELRISTEYPQDFTGVYTDTEKGVQEEAPIGFRAVWRRSPQRNQACCPAWTRPLASLFLRPRR